MHHLKEHVLFEAKRAVAVCLCFLVAKYFYVWHLRVWCNV